MATRSLNRVQLIGNLTRDPELRYTPQGTAVCTFGMATNRGWVTEAGEKKEEAEFHQVVTWNKLAEICSQFLSKGRKVFVEGRLQTRQWAAQDGSQRQRTEVVASDMIILDNRGRPGEEMPEYAEAEGGAGAAVPVSEPVEVPGEEEAPQPEAKAVKLATPAKTKDSQKAGQSEEVNADEDIPF